MKKHIQLEMKFLTLLLSCLIAASFSGFYKIISYFLAPAPLLGSEHKSKIPDTYLVTMKASVSESQSIFKYTNF
jgi:hypothetical protein